MEKGKFGNWPAVCDMFSIYIYIVLTHYDMEIIVQLWKYVSHVHTGNFTKKAVLLIHSKMKFWKYIYKVWQIRWSENLVYDKNFLMDTLSCQVLVTWKIFFITQDHVCV